MNVIFNLAWLIIVFPTIGLTFNAFFSTRFKEEIASTIAIAASGLAFVMSALVLIALMGLPPEARSVHVPLYTWAVIGNMKLDAGLLIDPLSATMLIVVTLVGTLIHVYSIGYMHGDSRYRRFFVYLNLFMVSMLILVLGDSYVTMFVGWEGVGLCSYLLIGFWFEKEANANAAKKAFIVNRVGDFGFTLGMFLIFATVGSLQYEQVFHAAENGQVITGVATAITLLLFVGATGKSAQIPLYVWLPDAMAGPTPVSALIHAATMVTAGVYMIARSHPLFVLAPTSQEIVAVVGAATALFAASIAVAQFDIKKVLVYSTISQLGFMVSAVGMGATVAGIFHLGTHAFFKALLFLGAGSVIHAMEHGHHQISNHKSQIPARGKKQEASHGAQSAGHAPTSDLRPPTSEENPFDPNDMRLMGGLSNRMPLTFWTYVVGAAALMGVPPLAGFWSKDEILAEAFHKGVEGGAWPFALAFWLLLAAAFFTAFYMTRQVLMVFLGKPRHAAAAHAPESPHVMTYVLVTLAFFAAIAGFINVTGVFTHWLEPEELFAGLNLTVAGTSIVVALLGIGLSYWVYRPRELPEGVDDPLRSLGFVFSTLNAKYKVDEFYDWLIVRRFKALSQFLAFTIDWRFWHDWFHDSVIVATFKRTARFLANPLDLGIIDGAVNGLARLIRWCSDQLRQVQTGYVRNYALSVLLGVVVIVAYFALR